MKDEQCVRFLQWALPTLGMRWPGFRKVRRQVCKRVDRRMRELGIAEVEDYRRHLEDHPGEWQRLDPLCRITISRFYRDKGVFQALAREVLPVLVREAQARGDRTLRAWSAGCGSGEEPYSLLVLWAMEMEPRFPGTGIDVVATDADPNVLRRARAAEYEYGSLKELPDAWRDQAFLREDGIYRLRPQYRRRVEFLEQDIRRRQPPGPFDLVLCRNLAFTYFDVALQRRLLRRIVDRLREGGALVIGAHERLPDGAEGLSAWPDADRVYRKVGGESAAPP